MVRHYGRSHFSATRVSQSTGIPVPVIVGIVIFIKAACIACCCIRYCCKKRGNNNNNNSGVVLQQASKPSDADLQNNPQTSIPVNPTQSYPNYSSDQSMVFGSLNQNSPYPPVYPMPPIGMNPPYPTQYPTYPAVNVNQTDVNQYTDHSVLTNIGVNSTAITEAHIHNNAGINVTDAGNPVANLNQPTENQNLTNAVTNSSHVENTFSNNDVNPTCTVDIDDVIQSLNTSNPGIKTNDNVSPNGVEVNSNGLKRDLSVNYSMAPTQTNHSANSSPNLTNNNIGVNSVISEETIIPGTNIP